MRVGFDLDGTLYDSLGPMFSVDQAIREKFGYSIISAEFYKSKYQTKDWKQFYCDLGIREEHIPLIISEFVERFKQADAPRLIKGGRNVLLETTVLLGKENVFIITNETSEGVHKRFERDGLLEFKNKVHNPFEGKAEILFKLASADLSRPFVYVGDIVSDGEACLEARNMGAENILFLGITHEYALNDSESIRKFSCGKDFCHVVGSLKEVEEFMNRKFSYYPL